MAVVGFLVFASALAASISVFWLTLVPALPRIVALLRNSVDPVTSAVPSVVVSEGRLRARARTVTQVARPQWRAAA